MNDDDNGVSFSTVDVFVVVLAWGWGKTVCWSPRTTWKPASPPVNCSTLRLCLLLGPEGGVWPFERI